MGCCCTVVTSTISNSVCNSERTQNTQAPTYVVLVPVCYHNCLDLVLPLIEKSDVRQDLLHA